MTLCIAWIRHEKKNQELVFATDSILTGGESWNHGVKLFELPRKDCLICFAGHTYRAYPLILNLISTIKHNDKLQDQKVDIEDVLYEIVDVFTELVNSIFDKPKGGIDEIGTEAKFLFGGWSWKENRFRIWRLTYSTDSQSFIYFEETQDEEKSKVCVFLGDPEGNIDKGEENISIEATELYKQELINNNKIDGKLDMEPLHILIEMSKSSKIRSVGGHLQIAKIYPSGTNEFFGIKGLFANDKFTFLGKKYDAHNKPRVKYYDPETCDIIVDGLPKRINNIDYFKTSDDYEFLIDCYSQEDNYLKENLTDNEKEKLTIFFQQHSYLEFIKEVEKDTIIE